MPPGVSEVLEELKSRFGERLSFASAVREQHGRGEGLHEIHPPDAVLFPRDNDEVVAAILCCREAGLPIIPYGAGTSLEGQVHALEGGLCIDLSHMDAILELNLDDMDCLDQAGMTREALNLALRDHGLFFPLDPGANATIGGMAATRASGTNAVRYGTMADVTMGLTVVTPDGELVHTGGRARKSSAGYDLTRLFIGSEGTLGTITEVRLRLFAIPEAIVAASSSFPSLDAAVGLVIDMVRSAVPIARVELLDPLQMRACIAYSGLQGFSEEPTLFLEFHGSPAAVAEQLELVAMLARDRGGADLKVARSTEERNRLWKARHNAYYAARALSPGKDSFSTDACVPMSALADSIIAARREADEYGLIAPIVGHVGDGNFHAIVLFDPHDLGEMERAEAFAAGISRRAIAAGGTCTGEHGIGTHKLDAMRLEHGASALALMRRIKAGFDPLNIMNPGKTIPDVMTTSPV